MVKKNIVLDSIDCEFEGEKFVSTNIREFLESVKQSNRLPLTSIDVFYSDDYWNFEKIKMSNLDNHDFHFDFSKCPHVFREEVKDYVLISICENREKINNIQAKMKQIINFLVFVCEHNYFSLQDITVEVIELWKESLSHLAITSFSRYTNTVALFMEYYNANIEEVFSKEHFSALNCVDYKCLRAVKEENKTPNIPAKFFDDMLSTAIKVMEDIEEPSFYRGLSAMLVIETQTGLRTGELFALEKGCVKPLSIFNGEIAYYLEYKTWKREKGRSIISKEKTFVNELTKKAYDILDNLYEEKRIQWDVQYLFLEKKGHHTKKSFPVTPVSAGKLFTELFHYYNQYFTTVLSEPSTDSSLPTVKYYSEKDLSVKYMVRKQEYVIKPTITQFRVHMCSELYEKGVPIEYVERFMSHLSAEMACYYVRPKNTIQENMDASMKIMKELVTGEVTPIGTTKGLVEKINDFIEKNNYCVEKDLDTICEKLLKIIPIRLKTGGVCIKSSKKRDCFHDAATNEFYCAYNVCPNIYTFYYMVDVSYRQYQELCGNIEINKRNGQVIQVQKEKNMLHTLIDKKLIPQLDDLKTRINRYGMEYIMEKHPELSEIIIHIDDIKAEVKEKLNG